MQVRKLETLVHITYHQFNFITALHILLFISVSTSSFPGCQRLLAAFTTTPPPPLKCGPDCQAQWESSSNPHSRKHRQKEFISCTFTYSLCDCSSPLPTSWESPQRPYLAMICSGWDGRKIVSADTDWTPDDTEEAGMCAYVNERHDRLQRSTFAKSVLPSESQFWCLKVRRSPQEQKHVSPVGFQCVKERDHS